MDHVTDSRAISLGNKFRKQFSTAKSANLPFQDTSRSRANRIKIPTYPHDFSFFFSFTSSPYFYFLFFPFILFPPRLPFFRHATAFIVLQPGISRRRRRRRFAIVSHTICCRRRRAKTLPCRSPGKSLAFVQKKKKIYT